MDSPCSWLDVDFYGLVTPKCRHRIGSCMVMSVLEGWTFDTGPK